MSVYVFKYLSVHIMIVYNYVYTCIHIVHTRLCDGVQWIIMSHMIQQALGILLNIATSSCGCPKRNPKRPEVNGVPLDSSFNQGEYSLSPLMIVLATISFVKPNILPYMRRKSFVKSNVSFRVLRQYNSPESSKIQQWVSWPPIGESFQKRHDMRSWSNSSRAIGRMTDPNGAAIYID